jgi:predicted nucleic-acid-binding protein
MTSDRRRRLRKLLSGDGPFWISRIVLLELGWVLRSAYGMSDEDVNRALHLVASFEKCELEDAERSRLALTLHGRGLDLGDAFIIAFAPKGAELATFDQKMVIKTQAVGGLPQIRAVEDFLPDDES